MSRNPFHRFLGLIFGLSLCMPVWAQGTKLVLGYANATEFLPAFVAKDKGIFARHGLDVTMTAMPSSSLIPPALISGSIHMGIATPPNLVLAADAGLDLVATSGSARIVKSNTRVSLVGRAGLGIAKAEDLRGKKVGVPGFNSSIAFLRFDHLKFKMQGS